MNQVCIKLPKAISRNPRWDSEHLMIYATQVIFVISQITQYHCAITRQITLDLVQFRDPQVMHWLSMLRSGVIQQHWNSAPPPFYTLLYIYMYVLSSWWLFFVTVRLRIEVLSTPSLTRPGFELMTSRSWQHTSCHWDTCSNHLAISDFSHTYQHKPLRKIKWSSAVTWLTAHFTGGLIPDDLTETRCH